MRRQGPWAVATSMAPLLALVLTALDLIRAVGVVGLGPVMGLDLDQARGLDLVPVRDPVLDRIQDRALARVRGLGLAPAMVPITDLVLDRRAARRALLLLRRAAIRLSNT